MSCDHNEMVANDDPAYVWKCAKCGYVYGKGGYPNAEVVAYDKEKIIDRRPVHLPRAAWEHVQGGGSQYDPVNGLPALGSNQSLRLIGDEFSEGYPNRCDRCGQYLLGKWCGKCLKDVRSSIGPGD